MHGADCSRPIADIHHSPLTIHHSPFTMSIWFKNFSLQEVRQRGANTMVEHIGIEITELGEDYLKGTMPVDHRTVQPMRILHGGASVALAETLGSLAANLVVDGEKKYCVGLDINANHIRAAKMGKVTGCAKPLHLGGTTQVWSIEITDEQNRLVCISRLTMAVLDRKL
ncbi:MAG: hotdog fold thioesterase [Flavisolibacter sp.]